jgi:hypothetical protein
MFKITQNIFCCGNEPVAKCVLSWGRNDRRSGRYENAAQTLMLIYSQVDKGRQNGRKEEAEK